MADRLKAAQAAYQAAELAAETARLERERAILAAVAEGCPFSEIGRALGVTRSRAHRLTANARAGHRTEPH